MLVRNVRLIPYLTDSELHAADLLIEGGRFAKLLPCGSMPEYSGEVFDAQGMTALPGLFDLHMHLILGGNVFSCGEPDKMRSVFTCIAYGKEMLRQGFTTVRDCGNPHYVGVAMRDEAAAGTVTAPRILTAGKCLSPFAKGNDTFPGLYYEVNTPDEILRAVRDEHARGVDFIKYMATGSVANLTGVPGELITTREELAAVRREADFFGMQVGVHCHGQEGIRLCAEVGIDTIEHASMIDDEAIDIILRNNGRTALVPTLDPVVQMHHGDDCGDTPAIVMAKIEEVYTHIPNIVKASRAGILTGFGTDVSLHFFAGHPGYEFFARTEAGYTPEEILKQATINSAKIVKLDDCLGTIAEGKLADLVLVDGRPDEDISVMYRLPARVFKEGKDVTVC